MHNNFYKSFCLGIFSVLLNLFEGDSQTVQASGKPKDLEEELDAEIDKTSPKRKAPPLDAPVKRIRTKSCLALVCENGALASQEKNTNWHTLLFTPDTIILGNSGSGTFQASATSAAKVKQEEAWPSCVVFWMVLYNWCTICQCPCAKPVVWSWFSPWAGLKGSPLSCAGTKEKVRRKTEEKYDRAA